MPRHSPTRRNRRARDWSTPAPSGPGSELDEIDLDLDRELDLDPEDAELDPDWKPARRSRLPKWMPPWLKRLVRIGFRCTLVALCLLVATTLFYYILSLRYDMKTVAEMPERSIIFDVHGQELATLHGESRRLIERDEIPEFFVKALQAREDKRFFKHHGVDLMGLARASLRNAGDLSFTQGASTLTMQLARNTFELREKSLHRKLVEIAISLRIEGNYNKDEILTAYVNRIYFGSGCLGLEEASRRYFGVSAAELSEHQCALLVGIIRGPHAFSPLRDLPGALLQRDEVLARMVEEGDLTQGEAAAIKETSLGLRDDDDAPNGKAALQAVRRHFEILLDAEEIRSGGLRVRSTIHAGVQKLLEDECSQMLKRIPGEPQVAAICIKAKTGGIRGIVGGRSTASTSFNRALDARRDLGSIFTPFIYAAAAERQLELKIGQPLSMGRDIGEDDLIRLAGKFGFEGPFLQGDDLFRGGISATPLEVAIAAASLTRDGLRPRHRFLKNVSNADLELLLPKIEPKATREFEAGSTMAALAMQFPDGEPRLLTGMSPAKTDVWAVSFGSTHTICIWIGHDKPSRLDDSDIILKEIHTTIDRMARSLLPEDFDFASSPISLP